MKKQEFTKFSCLDCPYYCQDGPEDSICEYPDSPPCNDPDFSPFDL